MIGDPLSEAAKQVVESFGRARVAHFAAEDAERRRSRERYLEAAMKTGFTESQAEFLWDHRDKYREWMA